MMPYRVPILILTTALLYIFIVPGQPLIFSLFFKLLPMAFIIYYAFLQLPKGRTSVHWLIITGLFFSAIGDATLHWFIIGLSAFFLAHVFYTIGFFKKAVFTKIRVAAIVPIIIYGTVFAMQLIPALQKSGEEAFILPVTGYIIIISLMLWTAVLTGNRYAASGSLLFVISDSVLAWRMFIGPVGMAEPLIMICYYGGQFLIASSLYTIVKTNRRIVW